MLLVCTGNTCRSIMAEALAAQVLLEMGRRESVEILSAGTAAFPGAPASPLAIKVMAGKGLDLFCHRARLLEPYLLKEADLVLVMTAGHKRQVLSLAPGLEDKVFTLAEYAGKEGDIPDPMGGSLKDYQICAATLEAALRVVLPRMWAGKKRDGIEEPGKKI